ncbi:MAG: Re/Si-specific NAD(P)(+) transhydrogenase subunit alpha [Chloroflexaceae bacterium]
MKLGVPKETFPGEKRVALIPADIPTLTKQGVEVLIEPGAGEAAGFLDAEYRERGAEVAGSRQDVFANTDTIVQVRAAGANPDLASNDLELMHPDQRLIAFLEPLGNPQAMTAVAERGVTAFSMELMPRISRAQNMDALSSMATIAGYKAVLLGATHLPRIFPMLMTAAGTIKPARVFVIGAGVAGLQALSTAKRLGAVTEAYDVRPVVKDQVESVGAKFVELPLETGTSEDKGGYAKAMDEEFYRRQRELMAEVVARSDIVITTAAIPGKRSPLLITAQAVQGMKPASVIVDLAAERGGNCELSRPDEVVVEHAITILGPTNLPATVPNHASQLYSRNIINFLRHAVKDGAFQMNMDDEITHDTLVTNNGEVVNPRIRDLLGVESSAA